VHVSWFKRSCAKGGIESQIDPQPAETEFRGPSLRRRRIRRLSGLSLAQEIPTLRMHNPPYPGEVIREYLGDMSVSAAANHLGVGRVTLSRVLNGKAAISPEMAVRFAAAFGTSSPEEWLGMQAQYDLWHLQKYNTIKVRPMPHLHHS
jgi:antitoxin HigA-1